MTADVRSIIHLDLDSFFVSVECLRNSKLLGKPLAIGGRGERAVVASCSYEARVFGVRSAMPMRLAKQLCPDLLIISGDMEAYSYHSSIITQIIADSSPAFEKSSIDEFYVDISGMDRFFGSYKWATELRQRITKNSGLPISMGLSINKMVSKVATGESKPNGQRHVPEPEVLDFLAPLPVTKIPMVGKKTAQHLHSMGVQTVQTLRDMPVEMLQAAFGKQGVELWHKAHGRDNSPVEPYSERKSISSETTFENDTIDIQRIKSVLTAMVEKLAFKLRSEKKLAACVTVKIRYANFDTVSHQVQVPYTSADAVLIKRVSELFDKLYNKRLLIRLVGVRLSHLVHGSYQLNLFDNAEENVRLYEAIDKIKHKFGNTALFRATSSVLSKKKEDSDDMALGDD